MRSVHEALVARDEAGRRVLACGRCDRVVCGYGDSFKEFLNVSAARLVDVLPRANEPNDYLDDEEIVMRRYCCPGCGVLMSTEVVRAAEPVLPEMRFQ